MATPPNDLPMAGPADVRMSETGPATLRFIRLAKGTARTEVQLGLASEQRQHATPEGGDAPVRLRQSVTLLGADDPAAPAMIGIVPAMPKGYVLLGVESWDSSGRQLLRYRQGNYCVPDPTKPYAPFDPCPR